MQKAKVIKEYFFAANYLVLSQMYLKEYLKPEEIKETHLKEYSPGHLGTSMSINFLLSNLYCFINEKKLNTQIIIGVGHAGVSQITNHWLNGTLSKYYKNYSKNKIGLNNLIQDFGKIIRSEINPQYPETVYDGGELGYSLGVAYGYALGSKLDLIPCIIGDGEAETGTICSSWQLSKILKTKSKVLPIINLNGYKMGSKSFLSNMNNSELKQYFSSFGYDVEIVSAINEKNIVLTIKKFQKALEKSFKTEKPLIIFKSYKGYTLPTIDGFDFQTVSSVHKNPLVDFETSKRLEYIKCFLNKFYTPIFDEKKELLDLFSSFEIETPKTNLKNIKNTKKTILNNYSNIEKLEEKLFHFSKENKSLFFSPDEIYSNKLGKLDKNTIEILNENLLQAIYQGYTLAGNVGFYISYEGFMPIISSMVAQYYKFLQQKYYLKKLGENNSLNYILTSTCWENTYSHQNPSFVNDLLLQNDTFYNVLYPMDGDALLECIDYVLNTKDKINVITTSKRHIKTYDKKISKNLDFSIIKDCENPDLILCATGDYMLDYTLDLYDSLKEYNNIKVIYITNPKILDNNSSKSITESKFNQIFNKNILVIYFFAGYPKIIKALLYERNIKCSVFGYDNKISVMGGVKNILEKNMLTKTKMIDTCLNNIIENNYSFWENYLKEIKVKILNLAKEKKQLYCDFHIHSNFSSDGKQTLDDILKSTNDKGFDVISITDHDNLNVYDELFEKIKKGITNPIVIPGIEFTIDNFKYGGQCHILQLFVNPKDNSIIENVNQNNKATFNRSKIQFKRLEENFAFSKLLEENKIKISYDEYISFLENNNLMPEYMTLCEYLTKKLKNKKITNFKVLEILEKSNESDIFYDRKLLKEKRYMELRSKYKNETENYYNSRFLLSILAVKEVDDDWWQKPSSGSLSVNSYGQIKIEELNKKYKTYFAHPSEKKLEVVKEILSKNKNIIGVESNIRNIYLDKENFDKIIKEQKLEQIVGSDSHDNKLTYYSDMDFYLIDELQIKKIIN